MEFTTSFKKHLQNVTWTKVVVFTCLFFVSVLLITVVVVVSQTSGSSSANNPNILKQSNGDIGSTGNVTNTFDWTILGAAQQGTDDEAGESLQSSPPPVNPIVRVRRQGRVQGTVLKSRQNRDYFAFYQVPYADDPVGELRFKPAKRPKRWNGIRNGTTPGYECIQKEKYAVINITAGVEGCLHLNIYTPTLPQGRQDKPKLPVMFYIHGGGPFGNGTRYSGKYFMDENVILVTVEFRIGGFTIGTLSYPGNNEYKDQVMALKWIQRNVDRFGGDPKKVLIFGNSSGSTAVQAHLLSPMSNGLFHRAILESGSLITSGGPGISWELTDAVERSKVLATEVGCAKYLNDTEKTLIDCMQKVDVNKIALSPSNLRLSGVTVEVIPEDGDLSETFMPDTPWHLLHDDGYQLNSVPIIVGINSREMMMNPLLEFLLSDNGTTYLNNHWNELLPKFLGIDDDENHTIAQNFRTVYFGDQRIDNDTRFDLYDLLSDSFVYGCRVSALQYANRTQPNPVYFYWLTKEPQKSYAESVKHLYPPPYGVAHADELQYLFLYEGYPEITVDSKWFPFSQKMVKIWTTFAETGKPMTDWPPIDLRDNGMKWFQLDDEVQIVEPFTNRMKLWDQYSSLLYNEQ